MRDKRRHPRLLANIEGRVRIVKKNYAATIKDVSLEGLGLVSSVELNPNTLIEIVLPVSPPIVVRAIIVHSRKLNSGSYLYGIKLKKENTADEKRFTEFYSNRIISKLSSFLHF